MRVVVPNDDIIQEKEDNKVQREDTPKFKDGSDFSAIVEHEVSEGEECWDVES